MSSSVILITGCSTGFGRSIALEALSRGLRVIATARKLEAIDDLREKGAKTLSLDVTASEGVLEVFVEEALGVFGQVDILVNNAGYLLGGAIEENAEEEIRAQFDTNFFSVINLTTKFLPHFRSRKTGTIVNISSQGAYLAISGAGIYCASKAALDCISEVWAIELAPFGIRTMSVNLGAYRTAVAGSNTKRPAKGEIEGYNDAHEFQTLFQERSGQEQGDPAKAVKKILDLIDLKGQDGKPLQLPARLALGDDAVELIGKVLQKRLEGLQQWREHGVGTNAEGPMFTKSGGAW
ncbi:short-chain oxidoreductase [Moniliophthora roreri MCA 2997]|uniref:Short-chain oxidoreductase n=2 Tax=Moniliophthora roreri TaxID=221103 RepID=V2YXT6_MONRO|nr:short-chain oxidoreductase [Moniliophthora roreri MCA 2997]KAI3619975.1 short-chain oxidoreductase [Moniliophthora roreri]